MVKKILIAVAWPYVNGNIHVGHLAGYLIPADITARYHRLRGNDVLMVSGSDCHGTPITIEADKSNITPQEVVDFYHKRNVTLFNKYSISYNLYTKTTSKTHKEVTHQVFLNLLKNGYIIKKTEKQYYSKEDNKFLPDRYVEGICPYCGSEDQRGDQCESCGRMIEQGTLVDPISKLTGNIVVLKKTEHYYIDLSKLEKNITQYIDIHKDKWRGWVYNESKGWTDEGLHARAITRDIDWGIEIPAKQIEKISGNGFLINNIENKRFYVWFEAVIGYLSASSEFSKIANNDSINDGGIYNRYKGQGVDWREWWFPTVSSETLQSRPSDIGDKQDVTAPSNTYHYYFMGQDNVIFHTIMWPAELLGSFPNIHLPDVVSANKFMNFNNKKFSKSRNWIIDSNEIADEFGVDSVRFYISLNLPENKESNFTWEAFIDSINNELVANLGNYINRTIVLSSKNFNKITGKIDDSIRETIENTFNEVGRYIDSSSQTKALKRILKLSSFGNKYFNDSEVWKLIKIDRGRAENILFNCLLISSALSILIEPFLPNTSIKLRRMLGLVPINLVVGQDRWRPEMPESFSIKQSTILINKIDKESVLREKHGD